jgi:hypothetical protein
MAIDVLVQCSDCGALFERHLSADDSEIICPECRRNMQNLTPEEFKDVEKTQSSQNLLGVLALAMLLVSAVLMYLWVGAPAAWVSTDNKEYLTKYAITREVNAMFLAGAVLCVLLAGILGFLASRRSYVVEI